MSMTRRVVSVGAVAAVALGASACSSDEAEPGVSPSSSTGSTAQESTDETLAPEPEESQSSPQESSQTKTKGGETLKLTVAGDQGVLALQRSGAVPDGEAGPDSRKLITGPGGCFAMTNDGPPRLVVFPADATFVLKRGKPSATINGTTTEVGRQLSAATTLVPKSATSGIPDRCARGSADTVVVID